MLRPLTLLAALAAVVATAAPAVAGHDGDRRSTSSRSQARQAPAPAHAEHDAPLRVTIDALSPSYIPDKGPVRVRGSVTNTSEDTWRNVNVYAFAAASPITSTAQLAEERIFDPAQPVGDRITVPDTFDDVDDLAPGESERYALRVPRSALAMTAEGVYWFGAHALGEGPEGRDVTADGRARTFLPLVARTRHRLDTALVVPVRREVRHAEDGSLADVRRWASDLDADGPLGALVDFGASAGSRPLTWLVDPSVPEAVQELVDGNPPRSLADAGGATGEEDPAESGEDGGPDEPGPTDSTTPDGSADPDPDADNAASGPGALWLERFREATSGDQVLALPFGDLDVSAAAERDPRTYALARQRSGQELQSLGIATDPAVSPPGGFVDPTAIATIDRRATILVGDQMFGTDAPAVARTDGRRLLVTSSQAAAGGPGPGDRLGAVAVRQQILSEAALRLLGPRRKPLVVVLPDDWTPGDTTGFFEGLGVDWVNLTDVAELDSRPGGRVDRARLDYPASQVHRELDAANFASAAALVAAAETLQNVLSRNDRVAAEVRDEALTGLSYASRDHPDSARAAADRSRRWIEAQLGSVTVNAPPAVTLSSSTGRFAATVTNGLDHPVRVHLEAVADEPLEISGPETIEIAAGSSTSVLLDASRARLGVSNVQLLVTDDAGTPLGASDRLPVRSVQVSRLIWVIIGSGVGLLFAAIAVRLVRRVRRASAA